LDLGIIGFGVLNGKLILFGMIDKILDESQLGVSGKFG
jgi:hypothetical protein